VKTRFGLRDIAFSNERGFELDGRHIFLKGVWIKVVGKSGLEVPDAQTEVSVSVEGAGRLLALDDGDHCTDLWGQVRRAKLGWTSRMKGVCTVKKSAYS